MRSMGVPGPKIALTPAFFSAATSCSGMVPPNTTSGIIYQSPNATGGGVEFDPSMAGFNVSERPQAARAER